MGVFLHTRGLALLSPAICDRCHIRGAMAKMISDPDQPGLFVHAHCADQYDPWKLPPRQTENIAVPSPRPDVPLATDEDV